MAGFEVTTEDWALDDGGGATAADSSGNSNTGTLFNGPAWAAGQANGALSFDGVDDHVSIPNSPSLSPTNAMTLAAWVNTRDVAATQQIIGKYSGTLGGPYFLRVQNPGAIRFRAGGVNLTSGTVLTANTWYYVAGTYDGSQLRLYVNGTLRASVAASGAMADNGLNVNIGSLTNGGGYFKGLLDEVRLYGRALTAQEVLALYAANAPSPSQTGQWTGPFVWPMVAVHMALLHTGEVLVMDGPPVHGGGTASLWNPGTNTFTAAPTSDNLFCAGHSLLADGRVLVAGGHVSNFVGIPDINIFGLCAGICRSGRIDWIPTTGWFGLDS